MGNLKDCDKLIDKIDRELSWRRKELTQLKFIVSSASKENERIILRSSIVLLYAHWEGFVKMALTFYLKHIVDQGLHSNELKPNFYAMSLLSEFEKFKKTKKVSHYISLTQTVFDSINNIPQIQYDKIIDTKSNLNSELFKELMELMDLDPSIYDTSFNLIDESLLAPRNGIAHGENRKLDNKSAYKNIHDRITQIMDGLATQIKDAAENKSYRKAPDIENNSIHEENTEIPLPIG
ncbi:MAG: MAE_28990/MAE_18760 family HEPN-like nuclease [Clostridium sp.]|nr:MAE_28990/MAE_18760 family HEPN-like nuclease [Clostridium sp.]